MEENWGYPHDYGNPYQLHATHDHWWEISENWWKIDGIYRQPSSNHIKSMVSRKFPKHQSIERRSGLLTCSIYWTANQSNQAVHVRVVNRWIYCIWRHHLCCSKMFQRCSKTNNFPASYWPEGAWGLTTSGIAVLDMASPRGMFGSPSKPHFLRPTDVHSTVGTIESLQPYILLGFYEWRCSRLTWTANHWSH